MSPDQNVTIFAGQGAYSWTLLAEDYWGLIPCTECSLSSQVNKSQDMSILWSKAPDRVPAPKWLYCIVSGRGISMAVAEGSQSPDSGNLEPLMRTHDFKRQAD